MRFPRARIVLVWASVALSAAVSFPPSVGSTPVVPVRDSLFTRALMAIRTSTVDWPSPCAADRRVELDSLFTWVKQGDRIIVPYWVAAAGEFQVLDVTPEGDILLALPAGYGLEGRSSTSERDLARVTRTGVSLSSVEGASTLQLCVLDSLPGGTRLGFWAPIPKREDAWTRGRPVIVRSTTPALPHGYGGPWGAVRLTVDLDEAARVVRTSVTQGVSPRLDAAAEAVVRRWKYRLNPPCPGMRPQRSLAVEVPFPRPRR